MYRDDLEAAQARGDALEREATEQRERAEDLEREAAELRAKNAELEVKAAEVARPEVEVPPQTQRARGDRGVTAALMRRSIIGWALMGVGVLVMVLAARFDLPTAVHVAGIAVFILGAALA